LLALAYQDRRERMMMLMPIMLTVAPMMSQRVGRWFSTSHNQRSATAM
jgi:hypothetical protein